MEGLAKGKAEGIAEGKSENDLKSTSLGTSDRADRDCRATFTTRRRGDYNIKIINSMTLHVSHFQVA